jgi:hypothetical protein
LIEGWETAVDDFVAGKNPLKHQNSTRFNTEARNSLNRNKLKIGHLQPRAQCDLQTGPLIFVFNNLQGEHLMQKQAVAQGDLAFFQ